MSQVFTSQRGFALASGIFLLVILAALGAFMLNLSVHQSAGHAADVRGLRAYQAARAGTEWGVYNLVITGACAASTSFAPPEGAGVSEFTVTVACLPADMATSNDEAGTAVIVRSIVATACSQPAAGVCPNSAPGPNYVERQISVVAGP